MHPRLSTAASVLLLLAAFTCPALHAQDPSDPAAGSPPPAPATAGPAVDDDLPQPLSVEDTAHLVNHSPFVRSLDLEDSLALTGVAYVEGKPVVTVFDRETKQSFVISEQPNAQGWSLKNVSAAHDLHGTQATVMIGQELVHLGYGDAQLTPGSGKKGMPTPYVARNDGRSGGPPMPQMPHDGSQKIRASSYLGEKGREMYASLSDEARDKFKTLVRERFEKRPDLTQDQREAYAQKLYASIKNADSKNASSPRNTNPKNGNAGVPKVKKRP